MAPLGAALGVAFGVTVVFITVFNYLVGPMSADLGLSVAELSLGLSLHLGLLILSLPMAGAVADRLGPQKTAAGSAVLYGACLWWVSAASGSRAELYGALALAAILGAGASPITYARALVARFDASRGAALGIALAGVGAASMILPSVVQAITLAAGWRTALAVLALLTALAGTIAATAIGDGELRGSSSSKATSGATLTQAAHTTAFWQIAAAFVLLGLSLSGVVAHLSEVWSGLGVTSLSVPGFQMAIGAATIIGRLVGGMMMDRWPAHGVGALFGLFGAAGLALLIYGGDNVAVLLLAGAALGLCLGAESDVASYLVSRYFGLANFARIYAVQASAFMVGLAAGPSIFTLGQARTSYELLLGLCAAGVAASALALATLRPPPMTLATTRAA
ncbi:MAG: MFS transporter [Phenylobacterium sp.]|nr:MFS transporter [Phenylobacterium sp.]